MASLIFNSCLSDAVSGAIDFSSDSFKCLLVGAAYSPDKDNDTRRSDITDEVTGSVGYTDGGSDVSVSVGQDLANDRINISLGGFSLPDTTITARYAVYYKARGGAAADDELVAVVDFGHNLTSTNGAFSLTGSTLRIQN